MSGTQKRWLDANPWYLELPEYQEGMVVKCPTHNRDGSAISDDDIPGCGSTNVGYAGDVYDCYECGIFFSDYVADPPHRREDGPDDRESDEDDEEILVPLPIPTQKVGKPARLLVQADGTVKFIYSDSLQPVAKALGEATTTRASHVEPDGDGWFVDLSPSGGPTVRGFETRQAALDYEVRWLNENVLK